MAIGDFGAAIAALMLECDKFGEILVSDGTIVDALGNPVPEGAQYAIDANGNIACIAKVTTETATDSGVDAFGVAYEEGAKGINVPGVGFVCLGDKDFDRIKTEGEVIPAGTVITDGSVDPSLLNEAGELIAEYTVAAGEVFVFDGDEACGKSSGKGDGYSQTGVVGPDDVDPAGNAIAYTDQYGNPIPDGVTAQHNFDSEGNYLGSFCTVQKTQWREHTVPHQAPDVVERDTKGSELSRTPVREISVVECEEFRPIFTQNVDLVTPNTAPGDLTGDGATIPDAEFTFTVEGCPQRIPLDLHYGHFARDTTLGKASIRPTYSIDGGPFSNSNRFSGITDESCFHGAPDSCEIFYSKKACVFLGVGTHTIRIRLTLVANTLTAGAVALSSNSAFVTTSKPVVCY